MGKKLALTANIVFVIEILSVVAGAFEFFWKGRVLYALAVIGVGIATALVSHIYLHTVADTNSKTEQLLALMEQKQETVSK